MSLRDLDAALELKWGFEHARAVQAFDDLATIALQALGGGSPTPPQAPRLAEPKPEDFPRTEEELRRSFGMFHGPG